MFSRNIPGYRAACAVVPRVDRVHASEPVHRQAQSHTAL